MATKILELNVDFKEQSKAGDTGSFLKISGIFEGLRYGICVLCRD